MKCLLLRGLTRTKEHWADFPNQLETALRKEIKDTSRVDCLDLPGFGTEEDRNSPTQVSSIVKDLRARWLEITEDAAPHEAIVLGISLGAMVSYQWMNDFPKDFRAGILINPSASNLGKAWERMRLESFWELLKVATLKDSVEKEMRILEVVCETKFQSLPFPPQKISRRQAARQLWAAARFKIEEGLPCPSLVLGSKNDRIVDPLLVRRFALRAGSEFHLHPSAGHDIPLDDPKWVIDQVIPWLKKVWNEKQE